MLGVDSAADVPPYYLIENASWTTNLRLDEASQWNCSYISDCIRRLSSNRFKQFTSH